MPKPASAIQPRAQSDSVQALLSKTEVKEQIKLALPAHMTPDRLLRIALTEVRRNPKLANCEQTSLLSAVFQCAQLGLEPGTSLGHAYLIPYGREVQFQIGYRGMIDLARRSGQIHSIDAHAVYEGDEFQCELGLESILNHRPDWGNANRSNPDKLLFAYAVAKLKDGGTQFRVMSRSELEAVRNRSRSGSSGPWKTDFEAMCLKTVVKRLFKWLPISVEMSKAIHQDDAAFAGLQQESDLDHALSRQTETVNVVDEGPVVESNPLSPQQLATLEKAVGARLNENGLSNMLRGLKIDSLDQIPAELFDEVMRNLGDSNTVKGLNEYQHQE